jgi:CheY-like chemotaxis protein
MRVLVADDDKLFAEYLAALCALVGHEVVAVETGGGLAVLHSYRRHKPECVLLDVMMPRFNGFTIAQQLRSTSPKARIIFMSGLVKSDYPSVSNCRPDGWLNKPVTLESLREALNGGNPGPDTEPAELTPIGAEV